MSDVNTQRLFHGNIMVVDDDASDLKFLSNILTNVGYQVRPATDGELALLSIQASLPELVLLDQKMPGLSGVEVCRTLKANPKTRNIPIIFLSSQGDIDLKVSALEEGAVDYINKPIRPSEVLARISTHLKMYRLQLSLVAQTVALNKEIGVRKRAEEELAGYRDRLEEMVQEKTSALTLTLEQMKKEIADRKRVEEALRVSEAELQALFSAMTDVVLVLDNEGRYIKIAPTPEHLYYKPPQEMLGKTLYEVFPKKQAEVFLKVIHQSLDSQDTISIEYSLTIGEKTVWFDGRVSPMSEDTIILVSRDTTDHKLLEQNLVKAKETAETASRAKSNFLAHMSHEIRTPISGILGMADLAASLAIAPEVKEYLKHVKNSGKKLLGIVNDILDLSKIEAGKLDIVPTLFAPREMLEKCLPPFSFQARQKGIDFSCHIAAEVPGWLEGDSARLEQIIDNLVGNALKYTEQGKVEMTVGLEAPPESHTVRLLVQVKDTGIGIPEDKLAVVFESFEQVDRSSTRRFQGTGLGLAISKRLLEMMGGRIWAESELGKGSIFFFMIPFAKGSEIGTEAEETRKIVTGQKESRWNVLVVEDDEVNRKFVELFLRQKGHHSVGAANGQEALKALEGERFDAVFMDIQMADMDGFEVTRLIRGGMSGVNDPTIPIIALTAYAMDNDRTKALGAGMNEYIAKPVDVNTLMEVLARVLSK